jgi:hypothetical protein
MGIVGKIGTNRQDIGASHDRRIAKTFVSVYEIDKSADLGTA